MIVKIVFRYFKVTAVTLAIDEDFCSGFKKKKKKTLVGWKNTQKTGC